MNEQTNIENELPMSSNIQSASGVLNWDDYEIKTRKPTIWWGQYETLSHSSYSDRRL